MWWLVGYLAIGAAIGLLVGVTTRDDCDPLPEVYVFMPLFGSVMWLPILAMFLVDMYQEWRERRWLDRETKRLGL